MSYDLTKLHQESSKQLEKKIKEHQKTVKERGISLLGNVVYQFIEVNEEGSPVFTAISREVCFGGWSSLSATDIRWVVVNTSKFYPELNHDPYSGYEFPLDLEAFSRFVDYIYNRSIFSAFIEKTGLDPYQHGMMFDFSKWGINQILGAACAVRMGYEFGCHILWDRLVKDGVNEEVAFIISNFFLPDSGERLRIRGVSSHSLLSRDIPIENVRAWLDGSWNQGPQVPATKSGGYSINKTWSGSTGLLWGEEGTLGEYLKKAIIVEGGGFSKKSYADYKTLVELGKELWESHNER